MHELDRSLGYDLIPAKVGVAQFASGSAAIAALITAIVLRYLFAVDGWQAQVRASARAEADALQARIKPHFLFNSMNTIAGLVRRDPVVAERAVLDLSDLFRAALGQFHFLAIEGLRLGERLQVRWTREEPLPWSLPLPRLVLQPLLENAVLHGVARLPRGGCVDIALDVDGDLLRVRIANPAPAPTDTGSGARHAQHSIGHRLAYAFGPRARMTTQWQDGYYRCELTVPIAGKAAAR